MIGDRTQLTQLLIGNQLPNFLIGRKEPPGLIDGKMSSVLARAVHQALRFVRVFGQRLLAEHMNAAFQKELADLEMRCRRRGDDHPLDVLGQVPIVTAPPGCLKLRFHLLPAIAPRVSQPELSARDRISH